ncbi:MAG TPA: rhomboid family intramembrane serine protease [Kofleriaceae bacterium]|jgi:membrane associated rhomboid family serine protease
MKRTRRWLALTVAASLVAMLDHRFATLAALEPSRIWRGELWRLVTWPFVERSPMSLIFTCVAIYHFGGQLAYRWGERRLRRFAIELVLAAAVATCLADAVLHHGIARCGGWAIADALVIAWARQFPTATLQLYGVLQLQGRAIVKLVVATSIVYALYAGPVAMMPELVACIGAAAYPRGWLQR